MKKKVLFLCIHNSARSQMAEEYLRKLAGEEFEVESAGFEPSTINPLVIQAMKEEGIDLTGKESKNVFDLYKAQKFYGFIVTVCDRAEEEKCPTFPGLAKRIHWKLEDPADFTGTDEEKLIRVKDLRNKIKELVEEFIIQYKAI